MFISYQQKQQNAKKFAGLNPSQKAMAKAAAKQQMPSYAKSGNYSGYNTLLLQGMYKAAEELGFYKKAEPAKPKPKPKKEEPVVEEVVDTTPEVTPETKELQDQTADLIEQIEQLKKDIVDPQTIIDKYKQEQAAIQEQQQATAAAQYANQAMSGLAPTLQIGGAAAGPMKTGTSAFKIKKAPGTTTSTINPLNIGSSSSLNV